MPFIVDVNTGDIRTSVALDYETQSVYILHGFVAKQARTRKQITVEVIF